MSFSLVSCGCVVFGRGDFWLWQFGIWCGKMDKWLIKLSKNKKLNNANGATEVEAESSTSCNATEVGRDVGSGSKFVLAK